MNDKLINLLRSELLTNSKICINNSCTICWNSPISLFLEWLDELFLEPCGIWILSINLILLNLVWHFQFFIFDSHNKVVCWIPNQWWAAKLTTYRCFDMAWYAWENATKESLVSNIYRDQRTYRTALSVVVVRTRMLQENQGPSWVTSILQNTDTTKELRTWWHIQVNF